MRNHCFAAVLACSIFAVSCVQTPESPTEPENGEAQRSNGIDSTNDETTGEGQEPVLLGSFGSNYFSFVTINEDDGADAAAGWQEAHAELPFGLFLPPRRWQCSLTVGMPLRTRLLGRISPSRAATLSGQIATAAGRSMDYKLPAGIFCKKLKDNMNLLFSAQRGLGARVTVP